MMGDYNIHMELNDSFSKKGNETMLFKTVLRDHNYVQHVQSPTNCLSGTIHLVISEVGFSHMTDLQVHEYVTISDHHPITFILDLEADKIKNKECIVKRDFKNLDIAVVKSAILNSNLAQPPPDLSLDKTVNLYNTTLTRILDQLCPVKTIEVTSRPKQQWYDDELKLMK